MTQREPHYDRAHEAAQSAIHRVEIISIYSLKHFPHFLNVLFQSFPFQELNLLSYSIDLLLHHLFLQMCQVYLLIPLHPFYCHWCVSTYPRFDYQCCK